MSYLAIARKYRPATFDEIVGQTHVTRTLRNALSLGRIHHAYLFTGARGVGKTTAARALSRALNCVNGPTPTPCGTCSACTEIANGMHPDLLEIDGASNNSVDDIRDLREAVRYPPTTGKRRIYIIDEVHMLSKGAFNALLKTLEEPPDHVVFLFATTEPNRIPDTILSRVQRFDFKRIPVPAVAQRLREIATNEGVTISEEGLRLIARAGEGSMRDAQSLLDQVIASGGDAIQDNQVAETLGLIDRTLLYAMLEGLLTGAPDQCLEAIDTVYNYGYELSQFTSEMLELIRNATLVQLSPGAQRYLDVPQDERQRLQTMTQQVDPDALARLFNAVLDVHDQVSRSSRPRILLEMAVARLASVRPVQPVAQLLGRLEHLERSLRHGGAAPNTRSMRSAASTAARSRQARSPRRSTSPSGDSDDDSRPASAAPAAPPPQPTRPPNAHPTAPAHNAAPPDSVRPRAAHNAAPPDSARTRNAPNSAPPDSARSRNAPNSAPPDFARPRAAHNAAPPDSVRTRTAHNAAPPDSVRTRTAHNAAPPDPARHTAPNTASQERHSQTVRKLSPGWGTPTVPSESDLFSTRSPQSQDPELDPEKAWKQLIAAAQRIGPGGKALASGFGNFFDNVLAVNVERTKQVVDVKRLNNDPAFIEALRRIYGANATLEVTLKPQQARGEDSNPLWDVVARDPGYQRVLRTLHAKLRNVYSLEHQGEST